MSAAASPPTDDLQRVRALPKAEIHVHLEGCLEPGLLARWAGEAGVALPRPRERLLEFQGLADFLHFLDWACSLAATRDRLAELAYAFCRRLSARPITRWKSPCSACAVALHEWPSAHARTSGRSGMAMPIASPDAILNLPQCCTFSVRFRPAAWYSLSP